VYRRRRRACGFWLSGRRGCGLKRDGRKVNHLYYCRGHLHQLNLDGQVISDMERDDLHREV
jgi:hypothetical protein